MSLPLEISGCPRTLVWPGNNFKQLACLQTFRSSLSQLALQLELNMMLKFYAEDKPTQDFGFNGRGQGASAGQDWFFGKGGVGAAGHPGLLRVSWHMVPESSDICGHGGVVLPH